MPIKIGLCTFDGEITVTKPRAFVRVGKNWMLWKLNYVSFCKNLDDSRAYL